MSRPRVLIAILFVSSAAVLTGCKSEAKRYGVSGTVKYKGTAIPNGSITFLDEKGGVVGGAPIKDGAFEIAQKIGLAAGTYKVSISMPDPKGTPPAKEDEAPGTGDKAGTGDGTQMRDVKDLLPAKYNRDTELKAEVKDGQPNDFPFDLK